MSVYVIANQFGHWLGKQNQWLESDDPQHCFRTPHYDIALNQLIEANAREIELRLSLLECPLDDKGSPVLAEARPARKRAVQFDESEETPAAEQEDAAEDEPAINEADDNAALADMPDSAASTTD